MTDPTKGAVPITPADAYQRYHEFLRDSDIINRILIAYPHIRSQQGEEFWRCAQRFNHLLMFLAQFMAFEGFVNLCLRTKGVTVDQLPGISLTDKVKRLAPATARDARWRDELLVQLEAELALRDAWMHGCGDDSLIKTHKARRKRTRIPQSVLARDPVASQDWISGAVWSETATLLGQLVERIADELGIPRH